MRIHLVSPAPPSSRLGNGVTALRWQSLFAALGHQITVGQGWRGEACDVLVAMHARRSHHAVRAYRAALPRAPLIVVLTGTDLYQNLPGDRDARQSLELASRLVVLQECGLSALAHEVRGKARVVVQSAVATQRREPDPETFDVCLLSHLRAVKDPLRPALAARLLPAESRVRIVHGGAVLDADVEAAARREMAENPRYRWLGALDGAQARELLSGSRLLALPSHLEGGANAVCEAIASGVPVVASEIAGNIGLLGADYAGYHPVGDTEALATLLRRVEADATFLAQLEAQTIARQFLVQPAREQAGWQSLFTELVPTEEELRPARGNARSNSA